MCKTGMKKKSAILCCAVAASVALAAEAFALDPVDCVNARIGAISHLLVPTFRTVQLPNAQYRFNAPAWQCTDDRLPDLWLFVGAHRDESQFSMRPYGGDLAAAVTNGRWQATWDQEHATPYRYDVVFDSCGVRMTLAPFAKGAVVRLDFGRRETHALSFGHWAATNAARRCQLTGRVLEMTDVFNAWRSGGGVRTYLYGEFDRAPSGVTQGERTVVRFGSDPESVRFRFAVSFVSPAQARRNLEAGGRGFDLEGVAADARDAWNRTLGAIEVEGGTADERTVFYTALWRTFERMTDVTEDGRYLGFDGKVHEAEGRPFYTDDWTWDTYRAAHPLMTILRPSAQGDKLQSFVRMAGQNKERWMPTFPSVAGDRHCMVNRHTSVMFLDAWRKGVTNFDARAAFEFADHTEETESLVPWYRGELTELDRFYKAHGYYPALAPGEEEHVQGVQTNWEKRQSVSVTQGASLDAWALAEFGREIGVDGARLAKYRERANGFERLWNAQTRFFHPKDANGAFIEPFDYILCGGFGGRNYYTENNAWTYLWDVQHALPRLVELMGGASAAAARLDEMQNVGVGRRHHYMAAMPDGCTGLMGVFTMANEPAFHIPYVYNFCGQPWKTQKFVRKTLECWFRNDLMGLCGDEDGGGMSAYAVFSMLGFYPVTPGLAEYQIGSPVFTRATIRLENGRRFVLSAPKATRDAKYVASWRIDGRPQKGTVLCHADVLSGATVEFDMAERPDGAEDFFGNEERKMR